MPYPESPPPALIAATRQQAGLTQSEAAAKLYVSTHTWQQWEYAGSNPGLSRKMHPAFWELFLLKLKAGSGSPVHPLPHHISAMSPDKFEALLEALPYAPAAPSRLQRINARMRWTMVLLHEGRTGLGRLAELTQGEVSSMGSVRIQRELVRYREAMQLTGNSGELADMPAILDLQASPKFLSRATIYSIVTAALHGNKGQKKKRRPKSTQSNGDRT